MTRLLGIVLVICAVSACTTGDQGAGADSNNTLGRKCTAQFTTAGAFVQSVAPPAGYVGCWPIGVWTFSATMTTNDCATPPTVLPQYQMKAELVTDVNGDQVQQFSYLTEPTVHNKVKVTQGGSGLCEGSLELFSPDGLQVWAWKPELNADNSVTGDGEYGVFGMDQWF